jgi:molecular chaperone HtpG
MTSTKPQAETLGFQAEVKQLLHLVTHALYSNKEIFLRELISNASDAADKLRFEALSDAALYENDSDLKIRVDFDAKERTVTVHDNGIGMSREETISHLGTIAKSGTREFFAALTGDQAKDRNLIGQFGVGFYSAFIIADKVIVKTRRAGAQADQGVQWESSGEGDYTVKNIEMPKRGTEIILHLKKDEDEFLDHWRLRNIITKYSDHILLPIVMKQPDTMVAGEGEDKEAKKVEPQEEVVNRANALWTLPKNQIKDEDYKQLYKHISHDFEDPLLWIHNQVEGKIEYISLLFIPGRAPFDIWMRDQHRGLKLYVRRVFIMDDAEQLLPSYLRFVRGIVDSNDLPLNISREILQHSKTIETIRNGVVKRVLTILETLSKEDPDKYQKFWMQFGQVLKEGPAEDFANREAVAKLLRFATTQSDSATQAVSLDDYVSRMKTGQDKIYYVTADTFEAAKNSPHLEIFRKKGVEVLLMTDRIDEWLVSHLTEYQGKQLQSVAKGSLEGTALEDKKDEEKQKQMEGELAGLIKHMQEVLGEKVKEVRISQRLTDSPTCAVTDANDMSAHLQRILQASGQSVPVAKPILEINGEHPLILKLKTEQDDARFSEWTHILFEQALLAEGAQLQDPAGFVKRMNALMLQLSG